MRRDTRMLVVIFIGTVLNISFAWAALWNSPYVASDSSKNYYYAAFSESPKTLDPAKSYSANEWSFIAQIYEPPLQYHYLKRPYSLIPLTTTALPKVTLFDQQWRPLAAGANKQQAAYSVYDIQLKPGIFYQNHPALAKDKKGNYRYHRLDVDQVERIHQLSDFSHTGSRELTAYDYEYQIKRLASPQLHSPVYSLLAKYIVGLEQLHQQLQQATTASNSYLDLRKWPLPGVKVIDKYHYQIILHGHYPQFIYWLAMPFFAPMPWEADAFYAQPGLAEHNISLSWYPLGSGAYYLSENNPNQRMVLSRNPNFHEEFYPTEGEPADSNNGLLQQAGRKLPFIDKFVFMLEKESIPHWNKFLQGYYDSSGLSAESFAQAVIFDHQGMPHLTQAMQEKSIRLQTTIMPSTYFLGFNMLDPTVGGQGKRARLLRQAISIALDYEEFIEIFQNGRGEAAQGPIPPGIWGYQPGKAGINPYVYLWRQDKAQRRDLNTAKRLLAKAGYPGGTDFSTGKPLQLFYDVAAGTSPDSKALFNWLHKQFARLGIDLHIRSTQYNRFQEKVRTGQVQLFSWGWHADYPDPENFFALLYSKNGKVKYDGENASNYSNSRFDNLFLQMRYLPNGEPRMAVINKMLTIVRHEAPWVWGMHPKQFQLLHAWIGAIKPHAVANNTLKYYYLDPAARQLERHGWNKPVVWPLWALLGLMIILLLPAWLQFWRKEYK